MKKSPVGFTILAVFQILNAVKKLAGRGHPSAAASHSADEPDAVEKLPSAGIAGLCTRSLSECASAEPRVPGKGHP